MKRIWLGLAVLTSVLTLTACGGGGGGSSSSSGGGGGGGGGGGTVTPQAKGTALITVDTVHNTATVKALDPASRDIFSGTAISLGSVKVNEDPGEVTTRQLAVTITNNTQGPLNGLRFAINSLTPVTSPITDDRANVTVQTYAGNGVTGTAGGSLLGSNIGGPYGEWVDTDGSIYVSSSANASIRKISGGAVSNVVTFGGMLPYGLVGDATYLYFTDYSHDVIYRVRKDGTGLTTIAGTFGVTGNVDGAPGTSKLFQPSGLTMDSSGNLWVADFLNGAVREVTGPGTSSPNLTSVASFAVTTPYSICDVNLDGVEYLAVGQYSSVAKITLFSLANGARVTLTGTTSTAAATGPANTVGFNVIRGITNVGGNFVVTEGGHNDVKVMYRAAGATATDPSAWIVASVAGSDSPGVVDGSGTVAAFNSPTGIVGAPDGSLLVADTSNNRVRKITLTNLLQLSGVGSSPSGTITVGTPDTYISSATNIQIPAFVLKSSLPAGGSTTLKPWAFNLSSGVTQFQFVVTVDGQTGYDSVLDAVDHATGSGSPDDYLRTLTRNVSTVNVFTGRLSDLSGGFNYFSCFAQDGTGFISNSNAIFRVDTNQNVTLIAGVPASSGLVDGVGTAARFLNATHLCCTPDGSTIYVADLWGVRRITGSGSASAGYTVTTIAGGNSSGNAVGPGNTARFSGLSAIALSPNNQTVYITDSNLSQVYSVAQTNGDDPKLSSSYTVTLLGGIGNGTSGFADGGAGSSKFNVPEGICCLPNGNLLVADTSNERVRMVTPGGVTSTFCGTGATTFVDGSTATATLNPADICCDTTGYAYVADFANAAVRRIGPDGSVFTVASSTATYGDGNCSTAGLHQPYTISVSPSGSIWFYDFGKGLRSIERIVGR